MKRVLVDEPSPLFEYCSVYVTWSPGDGFVALCKIVNTIFATVRLDNENVPVLVIPVCSTQLFVVLDEVDPSRVQMSGPVDVLRHTLSGGDVSEFGELTSVSS